MSSKIEKEIESLRREIDHHNELYYQKAEPEISDYEFDMLLENLKKLEAEHPELITPDSPTRRVGGKAEVPVAFSEAESGRSFPGGESADRALTGGTPLVNFPAPHGGHSSVG